MVVQQFGQMKKEDVALVLGKKGKSEEGGKTLEQKSGILQIKQEPGVEPNKVVVMAIVLHEDAAVLSYYLVEDEAGSD